MEYIVTVDEQDEITGECEKFECHRGEGILHRAFLVMLVDAGNRLLLAKRSPEKLLWPGFWDGTVASHVRMGETYESAARARIVEELGLEPGNLEYLLKFRYHVRFEDVGSENEICAVLVSKISSGNIENIPFNTAEVSELRFVGLNELLNTENLTPWLIIAIDKLTEIKTNFLHSGLF